MAPQGRARCVPGLTAVRVVQPARTATRATCDVRTSYPPSELDYADDPPPVGGFDYLRQSADSRTPGRWWATARRLV
jgi:hypothetical protein